MKIKKISKTLLLSLLCVGLSSCILKVDPNGVSSDSLISSSKKFSFNDSGKISGYAYKSYFFALKKGDKLRLNLESKAQRVEAWVYNNPTGSYQLSELDNVFDAPTTMLYEVRLIQPRAFARRNLSVSYNLSFEVINK